MCQTDGERHFFLCVIICVAEHKALIACALLESSSAIDTLCYMRTLLPDGDECLDGVRRESPCGIGVANVSNHMSRKLLKEDGCPCRDFPANDDDVVFDECFTGNARVPVLGQCLIEYAV